MFVKNTDEGYLDAVPGIQRKTLAYGDRTLLSTFRMAQGSLLPDHAHPYEQTGYLVSGHIRLTVGGETFDALPGDSWSIPADLPHHAEILADSVAVEVFSPLRSDYLPGPRG
jgi:quercetin dioxygenase-like cupin family protein